MVADKTPRDLVLFALAWIMMIAILVFPTVFGNTAAYAALVPSLLAIPLLQKEDWKRLRSMRFGIGAFALAFVMLGVAYAGSAAGASDLLALGDFLVLLLFVPAVVVLARLRDGSNTTRTAALALLGAALSVAVSIYQLMNGAGRSSGFTSSAIFMGNLGVMLGFLAATGWFDTGSRFRWAFLTGPALGILAAVMSGTKGALLVAIACAIVLAAEFFRRADRRWRTVVLLAFSFSVVALIALLAMSGSRLVSSFSILADLAQSGATSDHSTSIRLQYYHAGWKAFLDAPVFGHGWWRRFSAAMPYLSAETIAEGAGVAWAHLHNEVLNFASAGGIFGVVAYLAILIAPLAGLLGRKPDSQYARMRTGIVMLVSGFFVMGMTDVMFVFEIPKTFYVMVAAILLGYCADPGPTSAAQASSGLPDRSEG